MVAEHFATRATRTEMRSVCRPGVIALIRLKLSAFTRPLRVFIVLRAPPRFMSLSEWSVKEVLLTYNTLVSLHFFLMAV